MKVVLLLGALAAPAIVHSQVQPYPESLTAGRVAAPHPAENQVVKFSGYVCEAFAGNEPFRVDHERSFGFDGTNRVIYWKDAAGQVVSKTSFGLDPAATTDDVVDFVLPGLVNERFLRNAGESDRAILWNRVEAKRNAGFVLMASASGRTAVPFGYAYASRYSLREACPFNATFSGEGALVDNVTWSFTQDIRLTDCTSGAPGGEYRERRKVNALNKQTYFRTERKVDGAFVTESLQEYEYDEAGRLIMQSMTTSSVKEKYVFSYDALGFIAMEKYDYVNDAWHQVRRTNTTKEQGDDGSTRVTLLRESFTDGQWKPQQRERYDFDPSGRETLAEFARFDPATGDWYVFQLERTAYNALGLIAELVAVSDGEGLKVSAVYDENGNLTESYSYSCATCDDDFVPVFHAVYHDRRETATDFWRSEIWTGSAWTKYDSLANSYNDDGTLAQMSYHRFDEPAGIRYSFSYDGVVTDVDDETGELSVYPNPANGVIRFAEGSRPVAVGAIALLDGNGRLVANAGDTLLLEVSHLPPGLYLARISRNGRIETRKVVITR